MTALPTAPTLRVTSSRNPYLRAGLSWPAAQPVEGDPRRQDVDVRTLDGARFLELLRDPVLTVLASTDGVTFHPHVLVPEDAAVEDAQKLIDHLIEALPPVGVVSTTPPHQEEIAELRARNTMQTETIERQSGEIGRLGELIDAAESARSALVQERDTARQEVVGVRDELAAAVQREAQLTGELETARAELVEARKPKGSRAAAK